MKRHTSVYWASLISLGTAAVWMGVSQPLAAADDTVSNSAPATATTPAATPAPPLAFGVSEVVKMHQGGIGKDVLIGFIDNNVLPFHLDADGIIYLQHLGMPQEVTSALLRRDGELQRQANAAYQQQSLAMAQQQQAAAMAQQQQAAVAVAANNQAPAAAAPPLVLPNTPPPVAPYTYADTAPPVAYPDYAPYPYYPYYYGPDVVIGAGWGWGWGWGPRGWGWGWRGGYGHGGYGHGGYGGHGGGHR